MQSPDVRIVVESALSTALATKAAVVHTHDYSQINGTIPTSALPPIAVNDTFPVNSQAEMLALTAEKGDFAVRLDTSQTYILAGDDPTVLSNWVAFAAAGQVTSVAGQTGAVVLAIADVGGLTSALSGKSATGHTHVQADVSGLTAALGGKANTVHTHAITDVTNLQTALDGKQAAGSYAAASHTHTAANISDSTATGRSLIQATDAATARGIVGAAATSHSHATSDVTGLDTTLAGKASTSHTHTASQVSDSTTVGRSILTAVDAAAVRTAAGAAATSHNHATSDVSGLDTALAGKAATSHTHTVSQLSDATAYTRTLLTATDAATARSTLAAAAASHVHATSEVTGLDTALAGKAATSHTHTASQISDSTAAGRAVLVATDNATILSTIGAAASGHTHTAANISDSTTVGRSVLTAADAGAARTAIGAGSSNLVLGTTSSTAKAGDYQPTAANISDSTTVGRSLLTAASTTAAKSTLSLVKGDVGLGNVDNTADASKPVSTAQAAAIALKVTLTELQNTNLSYSAASALGARPTVPSGMSVRVYGGLTTDADPTWFIDGDYRDIPVS